MSSPQRTHGTVPVWTTGSSRRRITPCGPLARAESYRCLRLRVGGIRSVPTEEFAPEVVSRLTHQGTAGGMIGRIFFGPPDWLVGKFESRDRRAFGFWTIIAAVIGAIFFGRQVLYVTILSITALIPNYASETPVETEDE
jgi:hypothetical protein